MNCAAAQLSESIVESAQKQSSKIQFCGLTEKLLPKASFRVVLSAPKKGQRQPSQHRHLIPTRENRPASSTNANAFSAFGCRSDKNHANSKRWLRPEILPDPSRCGSGVDSR